MKNKRVLISGGGGFLGSHLAAALARSNDVILADKDEANTQAFAKSFGCRALLMEVTDPSSVRQAVSETRPDVIIHTAGAKSVDGAEKDPLECTSVNVLGSQSIARAAMEYDCGLVVGISSTRAAPPTDDTYGLTKAIMERLFCSLNGKTDTLFTSVRLGNIAWSTGSVLPVWQRMLDEASAITTTGPESRRFFMQIDEAVKLVLSTITRVDDLQGKVLAPRLKQARVADILTKFIEAKGGSWTQGERRLGEKAEEVLIGDLELPYCHQIELDGASHYLLCFNDKTETPPEHLVSTANAEAMSDEEITNLVTQKPAQPAVQTSAL